MISRLSEKNNYGGYTWQIKLDSLFHIFIHSNNDDKFVVEFKEWKWLSYKSHFSFITEASIIDTIHEVFDKVFDFFNNNKNYLWTNSQKDSKLTYVIDALHVSNDPEIQKLLEKKSNLLNIVRGFGINENLLGVSNSDLINYKYGNPRNQINHHGYSIEMEYPNIGISFYYIQSDPNKAIHLMIATGQVEGKTEIGLSFNKHLTMEKVFESYGIGEPIDHSEKEGYMKYSGIIFFANRYDLVNLSANKVIVSKIGVLEF